MRPSSLIERHTIRLRRRNVGIAPSPARILRRFAAFVVCGASLLGDATPAMAEPQVLRIGWASAPTAIDPHWHDLGPNLVLSKHLFEMLVGLDASLRPAPMLAQSWRRLDDRSWLFTLRPGAAFSDGSPVTVADVVYSYCRSFEVAGAPGRFDRFLNGVVAIETPAPDQLLIRTDRPRAGLLADLTNIAVLSARAAGLVQPLTFRPGGCDPAPLGGRPWPQREEIDSGRLAIGSGPYQLAEWRRSGALGPSLRLTRNPHHQPRPVWDEVILQVAEDEPQRARLLLERQIDLAEHISKPPLLKAIAADPALKLARNPSNRLIYLMLDVARGDSPGVSAGGRAPLQDLRVRQALSLAIDRDALIERLLNGAAAPAGQLQADGLFGSDPNLGPPPYDPDAARALLVKAGYAEGFDLVLAAPNNRYMNDERVAHAIAEMLRRVGIRAHAETMDRAVFFRRRGEFAFSAYLAGWGSTGEMSAALQGLAQTRDPQRGWGAANFSGWSDPVFDRALEAADALVDRDARDLALRRLSVQALESHAVLPLYSEMSIWGLRADLVLHPRRDQDTLATMAAPGPAAP